MGCYYGNPINVKGLAHCIIMRETKFFNFELFATRLHALKQIFANEGQKTTSKQYSTKQFSVSANIFASFMIVRFPSLLQV